jgi:hypothetical protein
MGLFSNIYDYFFENKVIKKLDQILVILESIQRKEDEFMQAFDDLVTQVTATQGAVESTKVLIAGVVVKINEILDKLANNTTDPAQVAELTTKLQTLTADLQDSTDILAAAVPA